MYTHMKLSHTNNRKTQITLQAINMTASGYCSRRSDNESREVSLNGFWDATPCNLQTGTKLHEVTSQKALMPTVAV
jgi:hypothetical protein